MRAFAIAALVAAGLACDGGPTSPSASSSYYVDCADHVATTPDAWSREAVGWTVLFRNTCDFRIVINVAARRFRNGQPIQDFWLKGVLSAPHGDCALHFRSESECEVSDYGCAPDHDYQLAVSYRACRAEHEDRCDYPDAPTRISG